MDMMGVGDDGVWGMMGCWGMMGVGDDEVWGFMGRVI